MLPSTRLTSLAAMAAMLISSAVFGATPERFSNVESLASQGKYAEAIAEVDALLKAEPDDARLKELRGVLTRMVKPAATTPAPMSQPSGRERLELTMLSLIMKDLAAAAADPRRAEEVKKFGTELLTASEPLTDRMAGEPQLWLYRAAAALATERVDEGAIAGKNLLKLGAADSGDATIVTVMAQLNRKGWLKEGLIEERRAAAESQRLSEAAELLRQQKEATAAVERQRRDAVYAELAERDRAGVCRIVLAIREGDTERVKRYLQIGLNLDARWGSDTAANGSLLHEAIRAGKDATAIALLDAGASPMMTDFLEIQQPKRLRCRATCPFLERLLNSRDLKAVEQVKALSLLHAAARQGNGAVVSRLVKFGYNVNATKANIYLKANSTPLQDAVYSLNADAVRALIAAGADVNIKNEAGGTLAVLKLKMKHLRASGFLGDSSESAKGVAIEQILKKAGAK